MNIEHLKELETNTKLELDMVESYEKKLNIKKEVLSFLISVFDNASKQMRDNYSIVDFYSFFPKTRNKRSNPNFEHDMKLAIERSNIIRLVCEYIGLKYVMTKQTDIRDNYEGIVLYEQVYVPVKYLNDDFSMNLDKEIDKVLSIKRYF